MVLIRVSPGFGVDPLELDPRLSGTTLDKLKADRVPKNLPEFYLHYLSRAMRGDLGYARTLGRPVAELIQIRLPVTARSVTLGLAGGWLAGLALAASSQLWRIPATGVLPGAVLCTTNP